MLKNLRDSELKEGDLVLNTKTSMAIRGKKKIHLTPQEFRLLEFMMRNKNNVLNRKLILNKVWLFSSEVDTRVVDVYIGYLRKKIDIGFRKKLILSKRGLGYILQE